MIKNRRYFMLFFKGYTSSESFSLTSTTAATFSVTRYGCNNIKFLHSQIDICRLLIFGLIILLCLTNNTYTLQTIKSYLNRNLN